MKTHQDIAANINYNQINLTYLLQNIYTLIINNYIQIYILYNHNKQLKRSPCTAQNQATHCAAVLQREQRQFERSQC